MSDEAWADPRDPRDPWQVSTMSLCSKTVESPTPILPATLPVTCMVPQDTGDHEHGPTAELLFLMACLDGKMVTFFDGKMGFHWFFDGFFDGKMAKIAFLMGFLMVKW